MVFTDNKLGATEQMWASQLAAFDFEIKYLSSHSNRNADALSRQYEMSSSLAEGVLSGTPVLISLQQAPCPAV